MAPDSKLAELPAWIAHHLNEDLSVDGLAKAVGMTRRTFARHFGRWHGGTPAKLVEDLRVEAACRWLEDGRTRSSMSPTFVASAMKNACEEHFYVALAFRQQRTEIDLSKPWTKSRSLMGLYRWRSGRVNDSGK